MSTDTGHPAIQITVDATEPHEVAAFWAAALGYDVEDNSERVDSLVAAGHLPAEATVQVDGRSAFADLAAIRDGAGHRPRILFQRVPEPKTAKNRLHLDLQVGPDAAPALVDRLLGMGAEVAWISDDRGAYTTTLRDLEGNELCVS